MKRLIALTAGCAIGLLGMSVTTGAQEAGGAYPANYKDVIAAGMKEGRVTIYSPTDSEQANALTAAFHKKYPGIAVDYIDLNNNAVYNRAVSEFAAKQVGGDILWSLGLDLQVKVVEDGLAEVYKSPEAAALPSWAQYKDTAYTTSVEPIVFLYNKQLLSEKLRPSSLADFTKIVKDNKDELRGKIGVLDPEKAGQSYVIMQDDIHHGTGFWERAEAFGLAKGKPISSSGAIREKIISGEQYLGLYVNGAYAEDWASKNASLGVTYPSDRTIAVGRVALITKGAPHPNAARLMLDFMLSKEGQAAMAKANLPSIREDVEGLNIKAVEAKAGGKLAPIALTKELLMNLDGDARAEFFKRWKSLVR